MWRTATDSSHLWKLSTNSSYLRKIEPVLRRWHEYVPILHSSKWERCEIWAQMLDPQNYRNWPYANFTFSKSDVLVPILHTMWNLRNVKFAVQQGFVYLIGICKFMFKKPLSKLWTWTLPSPWRDFLDPRMAKQVGLSRTLSQSPNTEFKVSHFKIEI